MKLKDVFEKSVQFFKDKKIETARLDAEILISSVLKIDRLQIYLKFDQPLSELEIQKCRDVLKRRSLGEPVAYIVGEKGFYREIFKVGDGVLIPRPETEQLVEEALKHINENNIVNPLVLDLGAGSGCIGLSIIKNLSNAKLVAIEKSPEAFKYLKLNTEGLALADRSELLNQDVMVYTANEQFDVIVANPPYIAHNDPAVEANVKNYEPGAALFSLNNGLEDIFNWSKKFKQFLKPNGLILIEMGYQQGESVESYFTSLGYHQIKILKDLSGLDRIIKANNN